MVHGGIVFSGLVDNFPVCEAMHWITTEPAISKKLLKLLNLSFFCFHGNPKFFAEALNSIQVIAFHIFQGCSKVLRFEIIRHIGFEKEENAGNITSLIRSTLL